MIMMGRFEIYQTPSGKYQFRLLASNGQIILSSDTFASREDVKRRIDGVRRAAADITAFERKETSQGDFYFVLKDTNGLILGKSEIYASEAARENGISSVHRHSHTSKIAA